MIYIVACNTELTTVEALCRAALRAALPRSRLLCTWTDTRYADGRVDNGARQQPATQILSHPPLPVGESR
jgi:hypothetical protein